MMIDMSMRGLSAPQAVHALGRPDLSGHERPGAALLGLVLDAARAGRFEAPSAARGIERGEDRAPVHRRATPAPVPDYALFDFEGDEDDRDMSL